MTRPYQPLIQDKDRSIRKGIERIYKKTSFTKGKIAEMVMKRGIAQFMAETPEFQDEPK